MYVDLSLSYDDDRPGALDIGRHKTLGGLPASANCGYGYWFVRVWRFVLALEVV